MRTNRFALVAILVLALASVAAVGHAASAIWKTNYIDQNWSNGANWMSGHPPNSGDDLTFPLTVTPVNTLNDLPAGMSFSSITFEGPNWTLDGNSIVIGEILCGSGVSGTNLINMPMTVNTTVVVGVASGCRMTLGGAISGPGGILATGGGPVWLYANNTYTGVTEAGATGGFLVITGTLSGTSGVTVNETSGNPTLRGSGTFSAPLNVEAAFPTDIAVVAPGEFGNTGILTTGGVSFGATGSRTALAVHLNGTTVGDQYDQLNVNGPNVSLAHVFLDVTLGFTPTNGDTFTIVRNNVGNAVLGTFIGLPEGAKFLVKETTLQISYVGGAGHDVVLTAVPTQTTPSSLVVDSAGNGVLEVGEVATFEPTWTNSSGSSAHLTGATSGFNGPYQPGTVFDNADASGDYGTLADGASAACVDCYTVQITAPGRPGQHWDARILETVAPFDVIKRWELHVGGSFPDVTTGNQFYKFVENLFHNGVTGGCSGGNYCPTNPVTRAQMAVFLLKGEHGGSYLPPACSSTLFTDVPCPGGGFVDWINQLSTEGITGGCGGGNYCPGNTVTRGQMAVFLLKGEHGGAYVPPTCTATVFTDVVCPSAQFVNFINVLAAEGVTGGCGGGDYCPGNPVNRGQMSAFLVKTFGLLLYGP
jgi:hypothetical protein